MPSVSGVAGRHSTRWSVSGRTRSSSEAGSRRSPGSNHAGTESGAERRRRGDARPAGLGQARDALPDVPETQHGQAGAAQRAQPGLQLRPGPGIGGQQGAGGEQSPGVAQHHAQDRLGHDPPVEAGELQLQSGRGLDREPLGAGRRGDDPPQPRRPLQPFLPEGPDRRNVGLRQGLQELLAPLAEPEIHQGQRLAQAALVPLPQAQGGQGLGHQPDGDGHCAAATLKRLIFLVVVISMASPTTVRRWIF